MDRVTVLRMSTFADRRRERRVERAAPRPTANETATFAASSNDALEVSGHRSMPARLRSVAMVIGLAGGLVAITPPAGAVVALDLSVSGPAAALTSGLQTAERLNPPPSSSSPPPPPTSAPRLDASVQAILDSVNAERTARGIAPLTYHAQLTQAALAHAADQFSANCLTSLSHRGTDGSSPGDRIARTGLRVRTWGENLACNQQSPAQVMAAWMNSAGHRASILNSSFTHIGISITRDSRGHLYWSQVFGTPA
jgi:uncharacterized protein YkwD